MGAVVQTAMVSAIGSARYTPVTASDQRCGSRKISGMSRMIFRQIVRKIAFGAPPMLTNAAKAEIARMTGVVTPTPASACLPTVGICPMNILSTRL